MYTVTYDGGRWWDLPYTVNREGKGYITSAMFLWSARWAIRIDRRKKVHGDVIVYRSP
jgi:hypothetical protein